jgi:hypothetical protein
MHTGLAGGYDQFLADFYRVAVDLVGTPQRVN